MFIALAIIAIAYIVMTAIVVVPKMVKRAKNRRNLDAYVAAGQVWAAEHAARLGSTN